MDPLLRRLVRIGVRRGSTSQKWLIIAICAIGLRTIRRMAIPGPDVLYRTEVHDGERFEISSGPG